MYASAAPASVASSAERGVIRCSARAHERPGRLDHSREEARRDPHLPGELGVVRPHVDRVHHEVEEQEDGRGVEPEGLRGHVVAPLGLRELPRLPRVIEVADEQRQAGPRQDPAEDQLVGQLQQRPADGRDDDQVDEVVDREPEEGVEVPADEERIAQAGLSFTRSRAPRNRATRRRARARGHCLPGRRGVDKGDFPEKPPSHLVTADAARVALGPRPEVLR